MARGFKVHELKLSENVFYDPYELKKFSEKQLRSEYTRLRDISQKRLKRMAVSDYAGSEVYEYNVNRFKKIKDIQSNRELRLLLADVSKFVNTESTTLTGQDLILQRRVESLRQHKLIKHERYPIPENKDDQIAFFKFVDWMNKSVSVDYFYDLSTNERRKLNQKKYRELLRSGKYKEAYDKLKGIQAAVQVNPKEKKSQTKKKNDKKPVNKKDQNDETMDQNSIKTFNELYPDQ